MDNPPFLLRYGRYAILCVAAAMEAKAAWEFLQPVSESAGWMACLLLHALACILLAWFAAMPPACAEPDAGLGALIFGLSFSLPLLGMGGILLALLPSLGRAYRSEKRPYGIIALGNSVGRPETAPVRYGPGGFRALLLSRSVPASNRMQALMAIKGKSTPESNRLMREMLKDPADELRLMAYGTLERREMEVQETIRQAKAGLRAREKAMEKGMEKGMATAGFLRRLAFLNWEVAYNGLAEGELSDFYMEQALQYTERSLASVPDDGALWTLKGRVLARLGRWDEAREALDHAVRSGAPGDRLAPRLAELAFQKRDFPETRRLLSQMARGRKASGHGVPALEPVLRFWLGEGN